MVRRLLQRPRGEEIRSRCAWIGLAAAQFARWNRLSDQFNFLVNDLYPDALELDEDYWPAHYEAGPAVPGEIQPGRGQRASSRRPWRSIPTRPKSTPRWPSWRLQNYDLDDAKRPIERALEINPSLLAARHRSRPICCWPTSRRTRRSTLLQKRSQAQSRVGGDARPAGGGVCRRSTACRTSRAGSRASASSSARGHTSATRTAACSSSRWPTRLADRQKFTEAEPLLPGGDRADAAAHRGRAASWG